MSNIPRKLRDAIADAVHDAVCDSRGGTDGFGQCFYYSIAGFALLNQVLPGRYLFQVGSLEINLGEPDAWLVMDAHDDGLRRGEFHAWNLELAAGARQPTAWIDFSARHYRRLSRDTMIVDSATGRGKPWTRPDPPPYLWTRELPDWLHLSADRASMETAHWTMKMDRENCLTLAARAANHWERIRTKRNL